MIPKMQIDIEEMIKEYLHQYHGISKYDPPGSNRIVCEHTLRVRQFTVDSRLTHLENILFRLEEERKIREEYPAAKQAYENYEMIISLCEKKNESANSN